MSTIDIYRARVLARGTSVKNRIENSLELDFEDILKRTPDRIQFLHLDTAYDGVLVQPSNTQNEKKIIFSLMGRKTEILPTGAVITIYDDTFQKDRYWIVLNAETKSYYGYIKYKVLQLDYILKFVDDNGEIQETPAYVVGSQESELNDYFKIVFSSLVQLPDKTLMMVIPENKKLNSNSKIMIGDEVWRYIDSDKISIPGVYYSTFYKTQRDLISDSIEEEIADIDKINNTKFISNYGDLDDIFIGLNIKNLQFELKREGKIIPSSIEIVAQAGDEILNVSNNIIIPQKEGITKILVKDKINNFQQEKTVHVQDILENYFYVIMNDSIPELETRLLRVNTDQQYSLEFDKTFLKIKNRDGGLEIQGLQKGETSILFKTENKEYSVPIKITSIWV